MSKICNKYAPKNKEIEFCKIDVEGYEKNVLLGYDFINFRPKVFCIESTLPGTTIPSYNEWEYILLENGYKFGFQYAINRYYFDSKINISKRFINLGKYIKEYETIIQKKITIKIKFQRLEENYKNKKKKNFIYLWKIQTNFILKKIHFFIYLFHFLLYQTLFWNHI